MAMGIVTFRGLAFGVACLAQLANGLGGVFRTSLTLKNIKEQVGTSNIPISSDLLADHPCR